MANYKVIKKVGENVGEKIFANVSGLRRCSSSTTFFTPYFYAIFKVTWPMPGIPA